MEILLYLLLLFSLGVGLSETAVQCDLQGTEASKCGQDDVNEQTCVDLGCCYNETSNPICYMPFQEQRVSVTMSTVGSSFCYFPYIYEGIPRYTCEHINLYYQCGTSSNLDEHGLSGICVSKDCLLSNNGGYYLGTNSVTKSGTECQRWDRQSPRMHSYGNSDFFVEDNLSDISNYCRNIGGPTVWCIDTSGFVECEVPSCVTCTRGLVLPQYLSASDSLQEGEQTLEPGFSTLYSSSAWCGLNTDTYLQVTYDTTHKVWGVITLGRDDKDMWMTSYFLAYSTDGATFTQLPQAFEGNSDSQTQVGHSISPALFGKYFRIKANQFMTYPCVRWELVGCEDVNNCFPNPCQNGGTCLDKVNSYECTCDPNFEGLMCENDYDDCSSDPCLNGGLCSDHVNSYSCTCQPGYTGQNCESGAAESCFELAEAGVTKSALYMVDLYSNELNRSCEMVSLEHPVFPDLVIHVSVQDDFTTVSVITPDQCSEACLSDSQCTLAIYNPSLKTCVLWLLDYTYYTDYQLLSFSDNIECTATAFVKECPGPAPVYCDLSDPLAPVTIISPVKSYIEISSHQHIISKMGTSQPIFYLPNTRKQLDLLKYHSVNCRQKVTVNCNNVDASQLGFTMNDGQYSMDQAPINPPTTEDCQCFLPDMCTQSNTVCVCGYANPDSGVIEGKSYLPVWELLMGGVNLQFGLLSYALGNLECTQYTVEANECESGPCLHGGTCTDGYNSFTCQCPESHTGPRCEVDVNECLSEPCLNSARCVDKVNGYNCVCNQGYIGDICDVDLNECDSAPCLNSGMCENHPGQFVCVCMAGYTGSQCEQDIDECESEPCLNQGQCKDSMNGYVCRCQGGYMGIHCETDINECESYPCQNDGSCVDQIDSYMCLCWLGTAGQFCEVNINECSSSPCQHNGVCTDQIGDYSCQCAEGYEGDDCERGIDWCSSDPCNNNGECITLHLGYVCSCTQGYTGKDCEMEIDECESTPCQNNGFCQDVLSRYQCRCTAGFTGTDCETNIDDCFGELCLHGDCTDDLNSFTCDCHPGYTGWLCDEESNECESLPCVNGATCEDKMDSFLCLCAPGYEGTLCQIDINECLSSPCVNGGSCKDLVADYKCQCMAGYAGKNCDLIQVDGQWGGWGPWTQCSVQCGTGVHTRTRSCNNPTPQNGGVSCEGVQAVAEMCSSQTCADIDGRWGLWAHWSRCSATCNTGVKSRLRLCDTPPPKGQGAYCDGSNTSTSGCKDRDCGTPVDGCWSLWGGWTECAVSCGVGTSVRTRSCTDPPPVYGGVDCEGEDMNWRPCFSLPCPGSKSCEEWTDWSTCTKTCGDGLRTKQRRCVIENTDEEHPSEQGEQFNGLEEIEHAYEQCEVIPCGEVECYHCSSVYDGTVASLLCKGPTKVCTEDRPLCTYSFNKQQPDQLIGVTKSCATYEECDEETQEECRQILDQTIDEVISASDMLDRSLEPHPDTLAQMWSSIQGQCRVCCKASRCNRGILPSGHTVYTGTATIQDRGLNRGVWILVCLLTHLITAN